MKVLLMAMMLGAASAVAAADRSGIEIGSPWVRATAPGKSVALVFATLTSIPGDSLLSVGTPAAASAVLRQMLIRGGQVGVRQMTEGLVLPARRAVALQPGGLDIMLSSLKAPLVAGTTIELTLNFKRAGSIVITVPVKPVDAVGP